MKFFISVDIEGISGIVDNTMTSRNQGDYERAREKSIEKVIRFYETLLI